MRSSKPKSIKHKSVSLFFLKTLFLGLYMTACGLVLAYQGKSWAQTNQALQPNSIVRISIPQLHLNLPVTEGAVSDGVWQINNQAVNHLTTSANPDEKNNIVIYGHNTLNLFGNLDKLRQGAEIDLRTYGGKTHTFTVQRKITVSPQNVSLVKPTDFEILTIYTCTGIFDSQRLILQAKPK